MANTTSQHILSTSANLLGFCLIVITSLHISNYSEASLVDEFTSVIALILILSSLFSFLSIRTLEVKKERKLESIADYLFVIALVGISIIVLLIAFSYIK
jgi:uncharacterized membrane protein